MKYRMTYLAPMIVITAAGLAFGRVGRIPLQQKINASDLIALVQIGATRDLENPTRYRRIAEVNVVQSIKGLASGNAFSLAFDNGLACPNVGYSTGEVCIIFASKTPSGQYHTYNAYYGKLLVGTNGFVSGKALWLEGEVAVEDAMNEIRKHLKQEVAEQSVAPYRR